MGYKIIEVHQVYKENKLEMITVLWQSNEMGWMRASYCTDRPCSGYKSLIPGEEVNDLLIQEVAGRGMNLPDDLKRKYFPGKKRWER